MEVNISRKGAIDKSRVIYASKRSLLSECGFEVNKYFNCSNNHKNKGIYKKLSFCGKQKVQMFPENMSLSAKGTFQVGSRAK